MRMVIVEVMRGEKRIKRYTEFFYGPSDVRVEDRPRVALENVKRKFGKCFPGCTFVHHKGNK